MNTARVASAAAEITRLQVALDWLEQYGPQLGARGDNVGVSVHPNLASACPGSKEAAQVLSAYARLAIPDLVETALRSVKNTIAMEIDAIRAELEPTP